jgi:succinyl-CoA synthetase beta subunit
MKIHEYQAKAILAEFGVPVPWGRVATTPAEARVIGQEIGGPVVVKAQIHAGGRGKGGGVKPAPSPDAAEQVAAQILGMMLRTHQTGPEGQRVRRVLVEEGMTIRQELYLGIVIDRATGQPVCMASAAGGMDIESRPDGRRHQQGPCGSGHRSPPLPRAWPLRWGSGEAVKARAVS